MGQLTSTEPGSWFNQVTFDIDKTHLLAKTRPQRLYGDRTSNLNNFTVMNEVLKTVLSPVGL